MKNTIINLLLVCCMFTASYAAKSKNQVSSDTRPKFRIGFDAPQIDHRQLLLTIDSRATDAIDYGFDGEMFEVIEDDMYWLLENRYFVIQATNQVSIDKEVPLGIIMSAEGEVQIKVDELENPIDSLVVYLKDKELNKLYNIQDSVYQTTLPQGEYHSRFSITFKSKDFVNEPEPPVVEEPPVDDPIVITKAKIKAFYNKKMSSIILLNKNQVKIYNVTLFSRRGEQVKTWNRKFKKKRTVLPVRVKRGMYHLIINSEIKTYKKKLLIK